MTITDHLKERLEENGLWPDEAAIVLERLAAQEAMKPMQGRWKEDAEGYPSSMLAILWMSAKDAAREYLKAEKPHHFCIAILEA